MSGSYRLQPASSTQTSAGSSLCDCCTGVGSHALQRVFNRPGLSALNYRIGTHSNFFDSLIARVATFGVPAPGASGLVNIADAPPERRALLTPGTSLVLPAEAKQLLPARLLREVLTTRSTTDPAIAIFDAWAVLADLLTFYQERLANEGFLQTARETRSLYELSRLVGYRPRPGVSSSVYLAFEVDDFAPPAYAGNGSGKSSLPFGTGTAPPISEILIPAGTAAKSTPKPGQAEEPQTFETSRELVARKEWNELYPRLTRMPRLDFANLLDLTTIYFKGLSLRIQPGDWVVIDSDPIQQPEIRQVDEVDELAEDKKTRVILRSHALATMDLIDDVETSVAIFLNSLSDFAITLNLQDSIVSAFTQTLLQLILTARRYSSTNRLEGTDAHFHEFVCANLDPSNIQPHTLSHLASTQLIWGLSLLGSLEQDKEVLGSRRIADEFKQEHDALVEKETNRLNVARNLLVKLNTLPANNATNVNDAVLEVKEALVDAAFDAPLPPLLIVGTRGRQELPNAAPFVVAPHTTVKLLGGTLPNELTIRVNHVVPDTIPPFETTHDPSGDANIDQTVLAIRDKIRAIQLGGLTGADQSRWVEIQVIEKAPMTPEKLLTTTLQEVYENSHSPSSEFPNLQTEKTTIISVSGPSKIDSGLLLADNSSPDGIYRVKVLLRKGSGSFQLNSNPDFGWYEKEKELRQSNETAPVHASQLQDALKAFEFIPDPSTEWPVHVVIVINKLGPMGAETPLAAMLRTMLPDADNQASKNLVAVRSCIAELHGLFTGHPSDIITIRNHFTATLSELDAGLQELITIRDSITHESLPAAIQSSQESRAEWENLAIQDPHARKLRSECISNNPNLPGRLPNVDIQARGKILTQLIGAMTAFDSAINFNHEMDDASYYSDKVLTLAADIRSAISDLQQVLPGPPGPIDPLSVAQAIETKRLELRQKAQANLAIITDLANNVEELAVAICSHLRLRQSSFQEDLRTIQQEHGKLFKGQADTSPNGLIENRLNAVLVALNNYLDVNRCDPEKKNTLGYQLSAVLAEVGKPRPGGSAIPVSSLPNNRLLIEFIRDGILPDEDAKLELTTIMTMWAKRVGQLTKLPPGKVNYIKSDNIGDLSQAINQVLETSVIGNNVFRAMKGDSDHIAQVMGRLDPGRKTKLQELLRQVRISQPIPEPKVYVFRQTARTFGWNAPDTDLSPITPAEFAQNILGVVEGTVSCLNNTSANNGERTAFKDALRDHFTLKFPLTAAEVSLRNNNSLEDYDREANKIIFLDGQFPLTVPDSVIAINLATDTQTIPKVFRILDVVTRPRTAYRVHNECTRIELGEAWWDIDGTSNAPKADFEMLRSTRVYCDAEQLAIAESPLGEIVPDPAEPNESPNVIVLDVPSFDLYQGKPLILEGKPVFGADKNVAPVQRELLEVSAVKHYIDDTLYGDRYVTLMGLRGPLRNSYLRSTVRIFANVVEATHGETQREVLGSGNGATAFPDFDLKRAEVSQVPAPTVTGTQSTLSVRVNDVTWDEPERGFLNAHPDTECFTTLTDDQQRTNVIFGDGVKGARLPSGIENIRAQYRTGLGLKGNVDAGQIDQVVGAPLGVKKVINPLSAQGGTDPEPNFAMREHIPLAVAALDRVVSVKDYADFARSYAGIGKASATRLQGIVHVTIAGPTPAPFALDGPIVSNLRQALENFGDPSQRFVLHNRQAALLIIAAKVQIDPRREWEKVEPQIRRALLEAFRYEYSDLGEDLRLSDAIATIQGVPGVVYVDLDLFDAVNEGDISILAQRLQCRQLRKRIHVQTERITTLNEEVAALDLAEDCLKDVLEALAASEENDGAASKFKGNVSKPEDPTFAKIDLNSPAFRAAQLCYLPPDVPDALILEQLR